MDPILVLVGLVMAILVIGAWQRTTRLGADTKELQQRLADISDRLRRIEELEARRRATPPTPEAVAASAAPPVTVQDAPEPEAPAPVVAPSVPPPPSVARPPVIIEPLPSPTVASEGVEAAITPPAPSTPSPVIAWLLKGNPLAKLGVVLMFFGLAYLLRFASERGYLPIEVRLAGAAAIAMALLVVGWRLRARNPVYAVTLQGGSIGALYLTSFAAFRFYSLLPHGLVFALLVIICAASVMLAVLQRAQSLALLASLGGYLAPILLSTGGGNYVALFSYYTLLSAGILAVSFWRSWRPLNLIGFAFTFGIGAAWGADKYDPSMYGPMQILLALNVLIYGILASFAALRQSPSHTDMLVDGTLVFGTPIVGFGLQVGLTRHWEYGPAFSALVFGAVYLGLTQLVLRSWPERARRLTLSFLALGGGFVTLAIPLALSARWTSMAWTLEGLGLLWVGRAQGRPRMIWSGTGLLALAAGSAFVAWNDYLDTPTFFMVGGSLSITWLIAAWLWNRDDMRARFKLSPWLLAGGVLVWFIVITEGSDRLLADYSDATMLALTAMSITAIIWSLVANRAAWPPLGEWGFLLWPVSWAASVVPILSSNGHPFANWWWIGAWVIAIATAAYLLRWSRAHPFKQLRPGEHTTFVWLFSFLVATEAAWRLDYLGWGMTEWRDAGLLVAASSVIFALRQFSLRRHWALAEFPRAYWVAGVLPSALAMFVLLMAANLLDGRMPGWPYIPVINPIELAAAFALLMAVVWQRELRRILGPGAGVMHVFILAGLVWWINGMLLRTLSTVGGVTWSLETLWDSAFIQTSMALAWTVAALVCMAIANRRGNREAWFVGAGALGVVVVKLFLVDSARGGGLARAIAFIGVAILVLVIGYLAPLPPRERPGEEAVS